MKSELTTLQRQSRTVGLSEGKPSVMVSYNTTDCCLRVLKDHRMGMLSAPQITAENKKSYIEQALSLARYSTEDVHRHFAEPLNHVPVVMAWDTGLFNRSVEQVLDVLQGLESIILSADSRIKKVLKLQFQELLQTKTIENSLGLHVSSTSSMVSMMAEILAEDGGPVEAGWDCLQTRFLRDLHLNRWAEDLAHDTVMSLGARPLSSGSWPVLFHPKVGTQLLSLISEALSAEAVQLGRSFFKGCLHKKVAADVVSLSDDPLMASGVASDSVDDEGTAHQFMDIMKHGELVGYFYDLRSASRDGVSSNGHGIKEGISVPPSPGATNLLMNAGATSLDDLKKAEPKIFFIQEVMGLHMADLITGEFSLGASGLLLENGHVVHAVRGVTIAGKLENLLKGITAVGNEIHWRGSFGAPYFFVSSLTVAGN